MLKTAVSINKVGKRLFLYGLNYNFVIRKKSIQLTNYKINKN